MGSWTLCGAPGSPADAIGPIWKAPRIELESRSIPDERRSEQHDLALTSLRVVAKRLEKLVSTLPPAEAAIIEANVMLCEDPTLISAVERCTIGDGLAAASALMAAIGAQADVLSAIDDPILASRGDDLRSLGRQAALVALGGGEELPRAPAGAILVAEDLGPGDVSENASLVAGFAVAGGGATTHAAIVARSLGVPFVCELGERALEVAPGTLALIDGQRGSLTVDPDSETARTVAARIEGRSRARACDRDEREKPAETLDGRPVAVLANIASAAEVEIALEWGATGAGLIRTELAFLEATSWPTAAQHEASLRPLLEALGRRRAIVRVLDLGGDKSPAFLAPGSARGLRLLMEYRPRFEAQVEALLRLGQEHDVRILLPLVEDLQQLLEARRVIDDVATRSGLAAVQVGSMIETTSAVAAAAELAAHCDFLSIGTNDLSAAVFERDRFAGGVPPAHHPRLLERIALTVAGAEAAGIPVEVCGEAASSAVMVPLLVGLGVDELSVGASAVGEVRRWVRGLRLSVARELVAGALRAATAEEVAIAVERELSLGTPR